MSKYYYIIGMNTLVTKVGSTAVSLPAHSLPSYDSNFSVILDLEDEETLIWTGDSAPTLNLNIDPISFAGTRPPHRPH